LSEKPCGAYFFAFFENFFVPILTSGGFAAVSSSAFAALYSAFGKYDVVHIHYLKDAFAATCKKRGTNHLQEQAEEIIKIIEADKCFYVNTFMKMLNRLLKQHSLPEIKVGIFL